MTVVENKKSKATNLGDIANLIESENNRVHTLKLRIENLLEQVGSGLHEREYILAVSLLASLSGLNVFLFGPPGTAKSLISRRLAAAFKEPSYFEYLMNRFSTPEEVFGPVSIKALKEDRYHRQVDGYLPTANFAFLDEIWKSSPAILNSLLTLVNEHTFKNGSDLHQVPLKSLISASNEIPQPNQGLDALYDRFVVRMEVPPISEKENFNHLLNATPVSSSVEVDPSLSIDFKELEAWRQQIHDVPLSEDTLLVISYIREELVKKYDKLKVYVSDRRWKNAAFFLKASAFFNGRTSTNFSDDLLLKYCLWATPEDKPKVEKIVEKSIEKCGFSTGMDLSALDSEKENLDNEIHKELFHTNDVYDTVKLHGNKLYFKVDAIFKNRRSYNNSFEKVELYIPYSEFKSNRQFHPCNANGVALKQITGQFDKQGVCSIEHNEYYYDNTTYTPKILFHKGDKRSDTNDRLVESLKEAVKDIQDRILLVEREVQAKADVYEQHLSSPFVSPESTAIAMSSVKKQLNDIKMRIDDCDRLYDLCN